MGLGRQILLVVLVLGGILVGAVLVADGCAERLVESETSAERAPPVIERRDREPPPEERVEPSRCPPEVPECAETEGEIFYVEAVDPDGDGDAHFVIWDSQSITLPGLTAIDVEKSLRPHPLPEPGDLVSAAGPVQTGSYDQSQIHALEFHVGKPAK
ncbi:MAG: hypothetical protein QOE75_1887 [Solirubrobacterales bacterium]|jgi:hypothetical protein|nr:hypothetical protein [Solirubrobacterales bacterium]